MDKIIKFLRGLYDTGFWGEIVLKWENGKIVHVKKVENIKMT
jgi:hypothetical protein